MNLDRHVVERFKKDQAPLLKSRVNVIFLMAIILVPLFGIIDYFLYPHLFTKFMSYRLVVSFFCLLFLIINHTLDLGHKSYYLGIATCYAAALAIIMMIVDLGGFSTPYYAGLNLVFIGLSVFLPVGMRPVLLHSVIIYLIYLGAVFLFTTPASLPLFTANNMFVLATLAIMVVGSRINHDLRLREYLLRVDLERLQEELKLYSKGLEIKVKEKDQDLMGTMEELRNRQELLVDTRKASIYGLAKLAESRDKNTGEHLNRIQVYCALIAQSFINGDTPEESLNEEYINDLTDSCVLHDLGKVAIPDEILLKPEKLTKDEFEVIKTHAVVGAEVLGAIEKRLGNKSFISLGREIAYHHHENYDGSGYPMGLKGKEIPLAARIVAVADTYDAITSNRCYRNALSHEEAVQRIVESSRFRFDPDVVKAFLKVQEHIREAKELIHKREGRFVEKAWKPKKRNIG